MPRTNKEQEEIEKRKAGVDLQKGNANYCQGCSKPQTLCICRKKGGKQEQKSDSSEESLKRDEEQPIHVFSKDDLAALIQDASIPAASFSKVSSEGKIEKFSAGVIKNTDSPVGVSDDTWFEAASLSKPVFAYIVLKMAERGELDLDRPLIKILKKEFGKDDPRSQFGPPEIRDHDNYKKLTARMLLSHQAGLPNEFLETPKFVSLAGKKFDYSGEAYRFLREVIEKITDRSIEDMAQEEFAKIGMKQSSFVKPDTENIAVGHKASGKVDTRQHYFGIHPAGSLYTTAKDYAKFLKTCVNDAYVFKEMFSPDVVKELARKDTAGLKEGVSNKILNKIGWGVGIGLQKNRDGSMTAFHWGDGSGTCRNFAAINLRTNQAVTCLTNSANGPSIFIQVCEPVVGDLSVVSKWLSVREKLPMALKQMSKPKQNSEAPVSKLSNKAFCPALELQKSKDSTLILTKIEQTNIKITDERAGLLEENSRPIKTKLKKK